jgi:hypothetical protein
VWVPSEFGQGGNTCHCRCDMFELMREDSGGWIATVMCTVELEALPRIATLRPWQGASPLLTADDAAVVG